MKTFLFISMLLLGATVDGNLRAHASLNLFDENILTVITAADPGTAFVAGPAENGRCVLLTAYHVVKENADNEPLQFISPKGFKFTLSKSAFKFDESLDIAFAPAPTCRNSISLPFARASAITVSTKVYIKGYPFDQESGQAARGWPLTVDGRITQYNDTRGYDLNYDAATRPGYSGGPVINADASELMAIHGFSDTVGDTTDYEQREQLRVGGRGVSAPLVYRFLKEYGYHMPRSSKSVCLVGVC
jgi:hypothetical protein